MPIDVVCSRCGGFGELVFVTGKCQARVSNISTEMTDLSSMCISECELIEEKRPCPECRGAGKVQELSFGERKKQAEEFGKIQQDRGERNA